MVHRYTPMTRPILALALWLVATVADASPRPLTAADRAAITALARSFFEAVRDGNRTGEGVFLTQAELRGLFAPTAGVEGLVRRQLDALDRDARELHARFQGGVFVGITPQSYRGGTIDLAPCGRFARATSRCGDGPVIEFTVGNEPRRQRIDTLALVAGRWRVFDIR